MSTLSRFARTSLSLALALTTAFGLSGCNIATPYQTSERALAPDQRVVVALTHAVLREDSQARARFWEHVAMVEASLHGNEGYLGFSKRRTLLGNDAWTMTVWEDERSLEAFVRSPAHQEAIRRAAPALESASFARLEVRAAELPLSWDRGLALLEASGDGY